MNSANSYFVLLSGKHVGYSSEQNEHELLEINVSIKETASKREQDPFEFLEKKMSCQGRGVL